MEQEICEGLGKVVFTDHIPNQNPQENSARIRLKVKVLFWNAVPTVLTSGTSTFLFANNTGSAHSYDDV